jgi:integrase/recombinase XerD
MSTTGNPAEICTQPAQHILLQYLSINFKTLKMQKIYVQVNTYLSHCRYEKNLSPKTIKAYVSDLNQFVEFLSKHQHIRQVDDIDKKVIREYIKSIAAYQPKTIKRKIASTKALFNFLEYEDEILINPYRKLKTQFREPKILPKVMNLVEVERILQTAYTIKNQETDKNSYAYKEKVRNLAIIELLFATGARVSEISGLTKDCIDLNSGQIKVKGKGNKERIIQVCNQESMQAVVEYNSLFESKMNVSHRYFFLNRLNNKLSEQSIRFLVKNYARQAGINRNITPHVFRHSFATLLLEEDVDIKYIQHLLGHSSIMTTQIYTHVNSEKQKQILTQNHPRGNFRMGSI